MSAEKAAAMATIKAAMMPQIDAALTLWLENMATMVRSAEAAEIDRCISIVELCRTNKRSPAWNEAVDFIADSLRQWKADSAEPTGSAAPKGESR